MYALDSDEEWSRGGENFDYSRCDCYCVAGRDEKGTGGWRRGERAGLASERERENNISPHSPLGDFPRERGRVTGRKRICLWLKMLVAASSLLQQLPSQQQTGNQDSFIMLT